jgi:hypothetical protein
LAGSTPYEAVSNFIAPLRLAVSCVTQDVLQPHGGYHLSTRPHALTLGAPEPARLKGPVQFGLTITQHYKIVETGTEMATVEIPRDRRYKVRTASYLYALEDADGREVLAYHWHPDKKVMHPHLHLGHGAEVGHRLCAEAHLPTERIALEALLRCAIEDLCVEPQRQDWEKVLHKTQTDFESWRTWP